MVYDEAGGRTVLFGGGDIPSGGYRDVWFLDVAGWSQGAAPPTALAPGVGHAMAYDVARQRVILYGGTGCSPGTETWELGATGWSPGPAAPPALACRSETALAHDAARGRTVLFGGDLGGTIKGDTWEYDGTAWTSIPGWAPPRAYHAMAYDPGRGVTVMTTGWDGGNVLRDTWEYDGTSWGPAAAFPYAAYGVGMVYVPSELAIAAVGGSASVCGTSDQMWLYDGTAWAAAQSLPNRLWHHGISFDRARGRIVVFGGLDASYLPVDDTWEYTTCLIQVWPASLPRGTTGTPYSVQLTATGGTPPYQFSLFSGTLPSGVTLSASGLIAGTPTTQGTFAFQVKVTGGCTQLASYELRVDCASIGLSPPALPPGQAGVAYSQTVAASGGTAPYVLTPSGTLPPGLSLGTSGTISGTPTTAGTFPFRVTATDVYGCSGGRDYVVAIGSATPGIAAGLGHGPGNANRVRLFTASGAPTPFDVFAYLAGSFGTNVACGRIDAGDVADTVTGPGPGSTLGPQVKAYRSDATAIAKVNFYAYATLRYGVNVAASNLSFGSPDEILTGPGPGDVFGPHVRGFGFAGSSVQPLQGLSFFAYGTLRYGVNPEGGDVDGIGIDEILTAPGAGPPFGPHVRAFSYSAAVVTAIPQISFFAGSTVAYGALVAGGDVDLDGFDEIATTPGPDPAGASRFLGFDYDGSSIRWISGFNVTPFSTLFGGRVALAHTEGTSRAELLAGPGPASSATADVRVYGFAGFGLTPLQSFSAFPAGYGATIGGGPLAP